jgi:hypothetical protein
MKKSNLKLVNVFVVAVLFMTGCQKENLSTDGEANDGPVTEKSINGTGCRVTSFDYYVGLAGDHQVDHYSYKDGLVDEWATWYGSTYKLEYDENNRLTRARAFDGDVQFASIDFLYDNNRVVRELWYDGTSDVVYDDLVYIYDRKGQLVVAESDLLGYRTDNVYTRDGDLESYKFYQDGMPVMSGHYTYDTHNKSPLHNGTPGVYHNFPYINTTFGQTKWWYSSEKIMLYDEFGTPSVYYDEDPAQTQWNIGSNGLAELVEYTDGISGADLSVGFGYENCREGGGGNSPRSASPARPQTGKISFRSLLQRDPRKSPRERVAAFRRQAKIHQQ